MSYCPMKTELPCFVCIGLKTVWKRTTAFNFQFRPVSLQKKQQSPLYQLKLVCNNEMCRVLNSMVIDRFVIVTVHVEYMSCNIQQHRSHAWVWESILVSRSFFFSLCSTVPMRSSILLTNADAVPMRSGVFLGAMQICIARISYGNVAGWLGGWLAVCHSRYCIKTTKHILKLFRPSGSPII